MSFGLAIPGSAPDGRFPAGAVIAGRYVVQRELGAGATGAVYEVTDAVLPERHLALKILHRPARSNEEYEQQREELRSMVQVRHPSIIALYDHGLHEGRLYSILPIMRGEALEGRAFSRKEVHRIGVMLSEALAALHGVGLTHQDIKPENARLTHFDGVPLPVPILLDLGTAVRSGTPMRGFSPAYIAPEVAQALADGRTPLADPKADVYSLAATFHALLEVPVEDDSPNLVVFLAKRADGIPPKFRDKKLAFLDSSFARWMARDPAQRPTAKQLAGELDALLAPERRAAQNRRFAAIAGVVLVVFSIAAYFVGKSDATARAAHERAVIAQREQRAAEARARAAQSELGSTRGELDSASTRVDTLTQEAEELASEARRTRSEAESFEARARRLDKTVNELNRILTSVRAALTEERRLRDAYAAQLQEREAQLNSARETQRATAAARDQAASEAARVQVRLEAVQAALDRSELQVASLRDDLARANAAHTGEVATLRREAEALSARIAAAEAEVDECKRRLAAGAGGGGGGGGGGEPLVEAPAPTP